jgi:hypothetical protein
MVDQLDFVLVLVLIGVSLGHFEEDADVGVLSDAVASWINFEAPFDTVDNIRVGVCDTLMRQQGLFHLICERLVLGYNLLAELDEKIT